MGLTVGGLSLLVAGFGLAKYASADVSAWFDGKELAFGLVFVGVISLSFLLAVRFSRTQPVRA